MGIYKRSRSSYKFVSKYLLCPSITTLDTQLRTIPLDTGCNNIIFKYLQVTAREMKNKQDLFTVLLWDEISVQPALYYDTQRDVIVGFEDWGMTRTRKIADHAILFYMRCLASGNHMPLGYGFCKGATGTIQLVRCVKQWLMFMIKSGFKPVATVCDQGGPNVACINYLIDDANKYRQMEHKNHRNSFVIQDYEIIPLYDYVHLQKGIRNNLLTKDLVVDKCKKGEEKQFASWTHIEKAYEIDKHSFLKQRQMPKLTKKHVYPALIPKMKVKYATQVLSHTVANVLDIIMTLKNGNIATDIGDIELPPGAAGTADVILFFDDLFDSFNGKKGQGLSSIINAKSTHIKFWQEAIQRLKCMEYVEKESHQIIRRNGPKCLKNWIWTAQSSIHLWKTLEKCGFSSLNMKYLNQDVVENCFSQIRDHGHRNNNPTPRQFSASFKTLLCTNVTSKQSLSSNCEDTTEGTSLALSKMFRASELASFSAEDSVDVECNENAIPEAKSTFIKVDVEKIVTNISKHTAVLECPECTERIKSNTILKEIRSRRRTVSAHVPCSKD